MDNAMVQKNYDLTKITKMLLEMRENCASRKEGDAYDDPKRNEKYNALNDAIDLINNPSLLVTGDTSDGYHTFNELYDHRAKLFSVIVRDHMEWCWKAKKHSDGTMYDGMFIVGINTPYGQASYHYNIDPYWDMFHCEEYEFAPEWDGHTPQQAIERISKIDMYENETGEWKHEPHQSKCSCSICGNIEPTSRRFCPECGTRMKTIYG